MVSLVVHSITFTFPVLHRAGDWHTDPRSRWYNLDLGSRLEWNWAGAAYDFREARAGTSGG